VDHASTGPIGLHREVFWITCLWLAYVGQRSFTSFECPTRCRHRDACWRSRLYQHRQRAMVVSSSVTRLCCWRNVSEYPVAISTFWACIYVLSYYNNCHPAGEGRCGQYFFCLLIACTLTMKNKGCSLSEPQMLKAKSSENFLCPKICEILTF